jgi:hypothetical protein
MARIGKINRKPSPLSRANYPPRGPAAVFPPSSGPAAFFPPPPPRGPRKLPPPWVVRLARGPAAPTVRPPRPPACALGSCLAAAALPRWGPPVSLRQVTPCSSSLSHELAFFSLPCANRSPNASLFPHRPPTGEPPPCTWPRRRRSSR